MKALALWITVAVAWMFIGPATQAQYKGARDYLPKDFPPPNSRPQPAAPTPPSHQSPGTRARPTPSTPQQAKFKEVPLNTQFYLLTDTNRASAWTKISLTAAKNEKTGARQAMLGETLVRR